MLVSSWHGFRTEHPRELLGPFWGRFVVEPSVFLSIVLHAFSLPIIIGIIGKSRAFYLQGVLQDFYG